MAGLYIHIPFCKQKCDYCDFVSFADCSRMAEYVCALTREFSLREEAKGRQFDTVFIGGGTPSVLPLGCIKEILGAAQRCFDISPDAEITVECNPGTADAGKFEEYIAAGVNRLSLGVQSLCDGLLSSIGRIHRAEDFFSTLKMARAAGFQNINADIMYGLPGQTVRMLLDTVEGIADSGVEHISAYSLILEEGTPLNSRVKAGKCTLPDEDATFVLHTAAIDAITGHGYTRYEISNYTKLGRECRHNLNYWDCGEYLGCGLAAHSAISFEGGMTRLYNTSDLSEYLDGVREGKLCSTVSEQVAGRDAMFEFIMLGLRKTAGISKQEFAARFGADVDSEYADALEKLRGYGWLDETKERLALNRRGLDMQNAALMLFMKG